MKRIVKRMVSLLLAAAFCLATGNLALAAEELKTAELRTKTTAELMDSIPQARTQAEADAVFAELMARKESGEALRGMIDSYVTANSTTMTSSAVTVNYTVNAIIPSGASLRVGYEYPAKVRVSGTFAAVQSATGTYTRSFSGPFQSCEMRAVFKFSANSYSETKELKKFMNVRGGTHAHAVTASDVSSRGWATAIAGLSLSLAVNAGGLGLYLPDIFDAVSNIGGWPALAVGQYYRVTTSVSGSTLTITTRVWASKADYDAGASPIASGTRSSTIPTF